MSDQRSKKIRVRILNPVDGGRNSTSLAHARRYERQGRAIFIGPLTIEFVEKDFRHVAAAVESVAVEPEPRVNRATSPTADPVYEYNGLENLRTFLRYPDDAENAFR